MKINFNKKLLLRYCLFLNLIVISSLLFISLLNHNRADLSIFYYDSDIFDMHSKLVFFGSTISALLYYYLGIAALFLPLFGFYFSYVLFRKRSIKEEFDRIVGSMIFIFIFSSFAYYYEFTQYYWSLFGKFNYKLLCQLFDKELTLIIINVSLLISLVLISRFSFFIIRLRHIPFNNNLSNIVENRVNYLVKPVSRFYKNIFIFFTQSNNEIKDSLFELEYASLIFPDEKQIENDEFWQIYQELMNKDLKKIDDATQLVSEPVVTLERKFELPDVIKIFKNEDNIIDSKKLSKESEIQAKTLEEKLKCFGVFGSVVSIKHGPVITLFEYEPQIDTKISKIIALEDDLAMALEATSIRILAPIPGKSVVGFEIANKKRLNVTMGKIILSDEFQNFSGSIPLVLGQNIVGQKVIIDLAKMPHLLVAGSTGSGKSVALNAMLISLLSKFNSNELKLILIDPKRLEFAPYADIAHLIFPIVTIAKQASIILRWLTKEMEDRYEHMAKVNAKNIFDYNVIAKNSDMKHLPYIVVMIDELADLMMTSGKDIEDNIIRIAQMARACGIHLIIATQRPSVDVITGLIKVNFPSRISFKVASKIDSRTILDSSGAEKLLGKGDMLFLSSQSNVLSRLHGVYVSDNEISELIAHVKQQAKVQYLDLTQENINTSYNNTSEMEDNLYPHVMQYLNDIDEISISLLQRKFRIGYNRSARIIELLELRGLIMPAQGVKPRKVIKQQK